MIADCREVLREANCAANLDGVLGIIVRRVMDSLPVDVCAIYLSGAEVGQYVLMAAHGLSGAAIGEIRSGPQAGLLGLVGERRELVVLTNASAHPRYCASAETGDERFETFLGIPLVHRHDVLGVLVAWKRGQGPLDDDEQRYFVTVAAQISEAIYRAAKIDEVARLLKGEGRDKAFIQGVQAASGVAIGTAALVDPLGNLDSVPDRRCDDVDAEETAFKAAIAAAQEELGAIGEHLADVLPSEVRELFDVHMMLLASDSLVTATLERIRAGNSAPGSWRDTVADHAQVFDQMEDSYLRGRGDDIREIGQRVLLHLRSAIDGSRKYPQRCILVADSVGITDIAAVPTGQLAGIVCKDGTALSHAAILAHALGVPAVVSLASLPVGLIEGCAMIVDGDEGRIYVNPSRSVIDSFEKPIRDQQILSSRLAALHDLPAQTLDGVSIPLYANIGFASDIDAVRQSAAQGVGLFRTEYQFLLRDAFPIEEEQYQIYSGILSAFAPDPVTIRTLDVGGDKILSYFPVVEENPFLGCRGIRFSLAHPEIFLIQLRAVLRANAKYGNLQVLFPMISRVEELDEALALLARANCELEEEGKASAMPTVGAMIEVPSAVFLAKPLANRVDFLSIGTNDLAQYTLAADRTNSLVATRYDTLHPAVLHAIQSVILDAHERNTPVAVCGEMAGDPGGALLLLGMGVDALSMSPAAISRVKLVIRSFTARQARALAEKALGLERGTDVFTLLDEALQQTADQSADESGWRRGDRAGETGVATTEATLR